MGATKRNKHTMLDEEVKAVQAPYRPISPIMATGVRSDDQPCKGGSDAAFNSW